MIKPKLEEHCLIFLIQFQRWAWERNWFRWWIFPKYIKRRLMTVWYTFICEFLDNTLLINKSSINSIVCSLVWTVCLNCVYWDFLPMLFGLVGWIILCCVLFSAFGNNEDSRMDFSGFHFSLQICIKSVAVSVHMQSVVGRCYFHVVTQIRERFVGWWASSLYALQSINRMEIGVVGENTERQPDGKEVSVQTLPAFRIMD